MTEAQTMLEPCPFCNSGAIHSCEDGAWHLVRCTNLKCGTQSGIFPTKPWAFRIWNTRSTAAASVPAGVRDDWSCGTCGDRDVPEKFRVFGGCYRCAAQRSIDKRDRKIGQLKAAVAALAPPQDASTAAAQPVAWRARPDENHPWAYSHRNEDPVGYEVQPLYAVPSPAQPVAASFNGATLSIKITSYSEASGRGEFISIAALPPAQPKPERRK